MRSWIGCATKTRAGSAPSASRLHFRGVDELARRNEHHRYTGGFDVHGVVHTARRARSSIGERFDHDIALGRRSRGAGRRGAGFVNVGLAKRSRRCRARGGAPRCDRGTRRRAASRCRAARRPCRRARSGRGTRSRVLGRRSDGRVEQRSTHVTDLPRHRFAPDRAARPPADDRREQARHRHRRARSGARRRGTSAASISRNPSGMPFRDAARAAHDLLAGDLQQRVELLAQAEPSSSPPRGTRARARARRRGPRPTRSRSSGARPCAGRLANERASDSGSRDSWSTTPRTPSAANSVTADACRRAGPARRAAAPTAIPASSSAKQNVYFPGVPSVARSTSPGRPPPTLRTTSCSARPIVAFARLPCPSALTPLFIPIARVIGPFTITSGPGEPRRREHAVDVELVGARGLDRGEHDREVLGPAARHHRVDRDLLDRAVDEIGRDRPRRPRADRASCPASMRGDAFERGRHERAARRSSRVRTSPRRRPRPTPSSIRRACSSTVRVARRSARPARPGRACATRSPAATRAGRCRVDVQPVICLPSVASPPFGAADHLAALDAQDGRHRVDVVGEGDLEHVSSTRARPGSPGRPARRR